MIKDLEIVYVMAETACFTHLHWIRPYPVCCRPSRYTRGMAPGTIPAKDGPAHQVTGLITFTDKDWSVLFLVVKDKEPLRGSAEGGTYTLEGDKLVFRHLYNLSGGGAVEGMAASDLTMKARDPKAEDVPAEPCTIQVKNEVLTIFFPSGNQMIFRRSTGP